MAARQTQEEARLVPTLASPPPPPPSAGPYLPDTCWGTLLSRDWQWRLGNTEKEEKRETLEVTGQEPAPSTPARLPCDRWEPQRGQGRAGSPRLRGQDGGTRAAPDALTATKIQKKVTARCGLATASCTFRVMTPPSTAETPAITSMTWGGVDSGGGPGWGFPEHACP